MHVRPVSTVPGAIQLLLLFGITMQLGWHYLQPPPVARAVDLPLAPPVAVLRVAGLGDPVALAKGLMLWLQVYDNQPGVSIPFRALNYARVEQWLDRILELDPRGQYPLLAASRLYGEVPDTQRQRRMLEFIYSKFDDDPGNRWPWLAHASVVAKHQLEDLPLALKYSRAIAHHATDHNIPHWASQMEFVILEDMGELDTARLLIGGLLSSGEITDTRELDFLQNRLKALE